MSLIQWCDRTINPIVGCSKISAGCANCYAETAANSARLLKLERYQKVKNWNGTLEFVPSQLDYAKNRKIPTRYFVCSMSDIFHVNVLGEWRDRIFQTLAECPQHTFYILSKRSITLSHYFNNNYIPSNIWAGATIENQLVANERIDWLSEVKNNKTFISFEPLLEEIDLSEFDLSNINWAIIGGESGKNSRPCNLIWMRSLVEQLKQYDIKIFVKQLGSNCFFQENIPSTFNSFRDRPSTLLDKATLGIKSLKGDKFEEFPEYLKYQEIG